MRRFVLNCALSQLLRSFSGGFFQRSTLLMHRHDAMKSHQLIMLRFIASRAQLQCKTRFMVESHELPPLACCPPDGKTAKRSDEIVHQASPLIPLTTLSTSHRKRRRDHLALTSGSGVARARSTVATVARMGVSLQMLVCATVALATQETYTKALDSLLALQVPTLPSL